MAATLAMARSLLDLDRHIMDLTQVVTFLQLSIGPVILISGIGLLLLSLTNRYGRVIDRARHLGDGLRHTGNDDSHILDQIGILRDRAKTLRTSISFAVTSVLCAAFLVIGIFIGKLAGLSPAIFIVLMFCACLISLVASLILFLADVNRSLAALDLDVEDAISRIKSGQ